MKNHLKYLLILVSAIIVLIPIPVHAIDHTDIVLISNHTLDLWSNESQYLTIIPEDVHFNCMAWTDDGCSDYQMNGKYNISIQKPINEKSSVEGIDLLTEMLIGIFGLLFVITTCEVYQLIRRG